MARVFDTVLAEEREYVRAGFSIRTITELEMTDRLERERDTEESLNRVIERVKKRPYNRLRARLRAVRRSMYRAVHLTGSSNRAECLASQRKYHKDASDTETHVAMSNQDRIKLKRRLSRGRKSAPVFA